MKRFRPRFTLKQILISIAVVTILAYFASLPVRRYYRIPANTRAVLSAVRRPIRLWSSGPISLETLLKNLRAASSGVPIYVDPIGLDEANKQIGSTVTASADRLSLNAHLEHSLKPLGLGYYVKDGMLLITSAKVADFEVTASPDQAIRP